MVNGGVMIVTEKRRVELYKQGYEGSNRTFPMETYV